MTDQHLDTESIVMLKDVMEDDFVLLVETFINDSAVHLSELHDLLAQQNADGVRRAAHSVKGSSSNLGALRLAEICSILEKGAQDNQFQGLEASLAEAEQEFEIVKTELLKLVD